MKNQSSFTLILRRTQDQSFTLIELLIVIGILAVLATVAVLALNPLELIKQARDSQRMADLATLNKALSVYQSSGQTNLGVANTVYVSIPKNVAADCSDLGLPALPATWSYACAPSSTLRNINGTGWIPLVFSSVSYGTPLEKLPIDPINSTSTRNYYTYVMGGSWELATAMESIKYKMGGSADKTSSDGGQYPGLYEEGTNLTLLPVDYGDSSLVGYWKFDEGSGTLYDSSGHGNNGTQSGGVTYGIAGKVNNALSFDGVDDYVKSDLNKARIGGILSIVLWIKPIGAQATKGILQIGDTGTGYGWIILQRYNSGGIYWYLDGGYRIYQPVADDAYYHLVLTYDGTVWTAFKNAVPGSTYTGPIGSISGEFTWFGAGFNGNYSGFLDDVRIYNRALSATEVTAIYNSTK